MDSKDPQDEEKQGTFQVSSFEPIRQTSSGFAASAAAPAQNCRFPTAPASNRAHASWGLRAASVLFGGRKLEKWTFSATPPTSTHLHDRFLCRLLLHTASLWARFMNDFKINQQFHHGTSNSGLHCEAEPESDASPHLMPGLSCDAHSDSCRPCSSPPGPLTARAKFEF